MILSLRLWRHPNAKAISLAISNFFLLMKCLQFVRVNGNINSFLGRYSNNILVQLSILVISNKVTMWGCQSCCKIDISFSILFPSIFWASFLIATSCLFHIALFIYEPPEAICSRSVISLNFISWKGVWKIFTIRGACWEEGRVAGIDKDNDSSLTSDSHSFKLTLI